MLKIVYKDNFDGNSNKRPFKKVNDYILKNNNYAVELYENEKIVNLNIPHYPIYCKCNELQWGQIINKVQKLGLL